MMESHQKVRLQELALAAANPRRLTAEEKDALLENSIRITNPDAFAEIKMGPDKDRKLLWELAEMLHSAVDQRKIDLTKIDYDVMYL